MLPEKSLSIPSKGISIGLIMASSLRLKRLFWTEPTELQSSWQASRIPETWPSISQLMTSFGSMPERMPFKRFLTLEEEDSTFVEIFPLLMDCQSLEVTFIGLIETWGQSLGLQSMLTTLLHPWLLSNQTWTPWEILLFSTVKINLKSRLPVQDSGLECVNSYALLWLMLLMVMIGSVVVLPEYFHPMEEPALMFLSILSSRLEERSDLFISIQKFPVFPLIQELTWQTSLASILIMMRRDYFTLKSDQMEVFLGLTSTNQLKFIQS